jgi:hypothetical protein
MDIKSFYTQIKSFYTPDHLAYFLRLHERHCVLKHVNADGGTGIGCTPPAFHPFPGPGPVRMVGPVVKGFRVGHQAKNPTGGITYPGNIIYGAVGVKRKLLFGRLTVRHGILNHDLVMIAKSLDNGIFGIKFAFTVPNREFYQSESPGKHTGGRGIDLQPDPFIPEIATIIKGQRNRSRLIILVKTGQKTQIDKGLESVANPEHEVPVFYKFNDFIPDIYLHADRLNHTCTVIVPPAEAPYKHHDLEIFQGDGAVDQGIDMNPDGVRARLLEGICGFMIAVQTISGQDQHIYFIFVVHHRSLVTQTCNFSKTYG